MRLRHTLWFLTLLLVLMIHPAALGEAGDGVFMMPDALRIITESAFENTAVMEVYLPGTVEIIGDRAFAYSGRLKAIYIPRSTRYIGRDAFKGTRNLTIYGIRGSYAERWAKKHRYTFVHHDVWLHRSDGSGSPHCRPSHRSWAGQDILNIYSTGRTVEDKPTTNPKERPEMYPLDYDFP